jgi:hypothetical protein
VFSLSYKLVNRRQWNGIIGNELTESTKYWFVAGVDTELCQKVVEADLGEGPEISCIGLELSGRSLENGCSAPL